MQELNSTKASKTPECKIRKGDKYESCGNCTISVSTPYNTTFECFNPSMLCGADGASSGRRLDGSSDTASEYAAMMLAILKAIASTLSGNPFAFSMAQGKDTIILVCGLFGAFIFGMIYFKRWDDHDYVQLQYVKFAEQNGDKTQQSSHENFMNPNDTKFCFENNSMESIIEEVETTKHNTFFNSVIPSDTVLNKDSSMMLYLKKLVKNHDFLCVFTYPSTVFPRRIRFFGVFHRCHDHFIYGYTFLRSYVSIRGV